jgi:hypothetical protein
MVRGEMRRARDTRQLDGMAVSARTTAYLHPHPSTTTVLSATWSAGERMQSPFQLSLADLDGGVLGYRASQWSGGQRAVLHVEQRFMHAADDANRLRAHDLGVALVAQAGRLWSDPQAPYTVNSGWQPTVGVALLAAPPGARRVWRVDLGAPLGTDPRKRFEVRLTTTDRARANAREPRDIAAGREATRLTDAFGWR